MSWEILQDRLERYSDYMIERLEDELEYLDEEDLEEYIPTDAGDVLKAIENKDFNVKAKLPVGFQPRLDLMIKKVN